MCGAVRPTRAHTAECSYGVVGAAATVPEMPRQGCGVEDHLDSKRHRATVITNTTNSRETRGSKHAASESSSGWNNRACEAGAQAGARRCATRRVEWKDMRRHDSDHVTNRTAVMDGNRTVSSRWSRGGCCSSSCLLRLLLLLLRCRLLQRLLVLQFLLLIGV